MLHSYAFIHLQTFVALSVIASTAGGSALAAENPRGTVPATELQYWMEDADKTYSEYCSAEQRNAVVLARNTSMARRVLTDKIRDAQAEYDRGVEWNKTGAEFNKTHPRDPRPYTLVDLDARRGAINIAQDNLTQYDRKTQDEAKKPIVDCSKPDPEKSRPPIWAGAQPPAKFDPALYRPKLPPLVEPPSPRTERFCSLKELTAYESAVGNAAKSARDHLIILREYVANLRRLKASYDRRAGFGAQAVAVQNEIDDYTRQAEAMDKRFRYLYDGEGSRHPGMGSPPNCLPLAANPAATATPTGATPTRQNPGRPNPATLPNPAPAAVPQGNKDCARGGNLVGGIGEVECEIGK